MSARSLYERTEAAIKRVARVAFQDHRSHPLEPAKFARVQIISTTEKG